MSLLSVCAFDRSSPCVASTCSCFHSEDAVVMTFLSFLSCCISFGGLVVHRYTVLPTRWWLLLVGLRFSVVCFVWLIVPYRRVYLSLVCCPTISTCLDYSFLFLITVWVASKFYAYTALVEADGSVVEVGANFPWKYVVWNFSGFSCWLTDPSGFSGLILFAFCATPSLPTFSFFGQNGFFWLCRVGLVAFPLVWAVRHVFWFVVRWIRRGCLLDR